MNTVNTTKVMLFLVALSLGLVAPISNAFAQAAGGGKGDPVSVSAQLDRTTVYINDSAVLTISVEGSSSPDRPALRLPDGIDGEFLGGGDNSSTFTAIINGSVQKRVTHQYQFRYRLTPAREGVYAIPGPEVTVSGRVYSAPPVRLAVVRPEQGGDFALRVEADNRDLYVGEPTRLRIVWTLAADVKSASFSRMPGLDAFELGTPRDRFPSGRAGGEDSSRVEVSMFGRTVVGTRGSETVSGKQLTTLTFDVVIVPNSSGTHDLGPMSITFDAVTGQRQRSFFDAPWDDPSITRRMSVMSDPVAVKVKPLPEAGRPADFTGLVGRYTLKTMAEPTSVSVGDPITLKLIVDGPDPTSRIEPPDLARLPDFGAFKISSEGWRDDSGDLPGPRAFSTTIRVTDAKTTEIPALEIPSFDPERGEYFRARSVPIALTVRPTREITSADAVGAMPRPIPVGPTTSLDSAGAGPVANSGGAWVLADEGGGLFETVRSPLVAGVLIAPPLAFFAATLVRIKRQRDGHESARIARARREAVSSLTRAPADSLSPAAIATALRRYAGAILRINPDAVTPVDCDGGERGDAHELAEIGRVLGDCDAGRFGGSPESAGALAARALAALEGRAPKGDPA